MSLLSLQTFAPLLSNVIYEVITKVLANCIKLFLPNIISPNQTSFIAGQNATNNAIDLQEVVHSMNHMAGKKRFMVVKLDLAKAYEKMEWSFVHDSLERLRFPQHIIDVIHACMSTAAFRINWQGRTSQQFSSSRGLHQGDLCLCSFSLLLLSV